MSAPIALSARRAEPWDDPWARFGDRWRGAPLQRAADRLLVWLERAHQRRQLRALDDRLLRDLGISRADAEAEAAKPFWRP